MSLRSNNAQRRSSYRLSRQGFSPIPNDSGAANMQQAGDATIDIPMSDMNNGEGRQNSTTPFASNAAGTGFTKEAAAEREHGHTFAGRRIKKTKSREQAGKIGYDGEEDTLNKMGKIYSKITGFSTLTRYLVYVTPLALCIAIPIIVGATSAQGAKLGGVRIVWFFTWIEIGASRFPPS